MPRSSRSSSRRASIAAEKKEKKGDNTAESSDNAAVGNDNTSTSPKPSEKIALSQINKPSEESIVLSYLRRHGLTDAASELQTILEKDKDDTSAAASATTTSKKNKRKRSKDDEEDDDKNKKLPPIDYDVKDEDLLEYEDIKNFNTNPSSSLVKKALGGGGYGYDLDAAPSIAMWGAGSLPPVLRNRKVTELLLEGRAVDNDTAEEDNDKAANDKDGDTQMEDTEKSKDKKKDAEEVEAMVNFRDEARRYIEGFTSLVTWILTLPDDPANPIVTPMICGRPPFSKTGVESKMETEGDKKESGNKETHTPHEGLVNLVKHSLATVENYDPSKPKPPAPHTLTLPLGATAAIPSEGDIEHDPLLLPPSCKPELLELSFPLLVHTYCELLTCGLEHTAVAMLDTYRHLYEAQHHTEIAELDKCQTTKRIVELNDDVLAQTALHSENRMLTSRIGEIAKHLGKVEAERNMLKHKVKRTDEEERLYQEHIKNIQKIKGMYGQTRDKVSTVTSKNDALTTKLQTLPFLRRLRALKWNITISSSAFGALTSFVSSRDELLPMSALLQSRCRLIVERRDPQPFCPPSILGDVDGNKEAEDICWAAPIDPIARAIEAGEDVALSGVPGSESHHKLAQSILTQSEALPFPKLRLEDGDESKDAESRAAVEFNRALLVNGFRRLQALELKQEYEAGLLPSSRSSQVHIADALQPSVLLATLCSSSSSLSNEADAGAGPTTPSPSWVESNVGIVSASICPPDGRLTAVGCDDAAVRIWSLDQSSKNKHDSSSLGEPSMVLLGHKNGFPVFDVDWTRNGRTLLSAGGDGSVRLWDTQAVGPYGKLSTTSSIQRNNANHTIGGPASTSLSSPVIPGAKAESLVQVGGTALSVYRGHAPSTPVWSVSSAPCGYYFASAGSDYTARIWTTDRTSPVRILSGHVSPSVNCVTWHTNCNYVVTASDDKTCRMFDIQTGKCVRLLSGSARGLNLVRVSPSGRYAAGSGYDGIVRIWDLSNGRLINELRAPSTDATQSAYSEGLVSAMTFSACGSALAVSGEDSTVRIWDVRGAGNHLSNPDYFAATRGSTATSSFSNGLSGAMPQSQMNRMPANERLRPGTREPTKIFKTNNISIRDLKFTKRNLLLAVGCSD